MENSVAKVRPDLAPEWSEKNGILKPDSVSYGSNKKIFWKGKCGHEWTATVKNRTSNNAGCPYCSHNKILKGFNDLASQNPDLTSEWSEKNLPLTPDQVTPFSNKKAWWKGKCGHEWYALISSRSDGHGCPYCEDKKMLRGFNDFKSVHPELVAEWSEKNSPIKPEDIPEKKKGLFWWKCSVCGGEYQAWITSRLKGSGCPYCSGRIVCKGINDLTTTDPDIASEWDYDLNAGTTPDSVFRTSKKIYWWKCKCGHSWKAKPYERTVERIPCRVCEKNFISALPELLILFYAGQNEIQVLFSSDVPIGIPLEMYLPEIKIAVEKQSRKGLSREQIVKKYLCETKEIAYVTYGDFNEAEDALRFVRDIFKPGHIYINEKTEDALEACRSMYSRMQTLNCR